MSDPHPARFVEREDKRSFLQKLAEFIHPGPDSTDELIETLAEAEAQHIEQTLKLLNWRISGANGAASVLGVPPSTLRSRMKKLGITRQITNDE